MFTTVITKENTKRSKCLKYQARFLVLKFNNIREFITYSVNCAANLIFRNAIVT